MWESPRENGRSLESGLRAIELFPQNKDSKERPPWGLQEAPVPNWPAVAAPILGDPSPKALRYCSPPLLLLGDPTPSPSPTTAIGRGRGFSSFQKLCCTRVRRAGGSKNHCNIVLGPRRQTGGFTCFRPRAPSPNGGFHILLDCWLRVDQDTSFSTQASQRQRLKLPTYPSARSTSVQAWLLSLLRNEWHWR